MDISVLLVDEQFLIAATKLIAAAQKSIYISTFKAEMSTKPRGKRLTQLFDTVIEKSRLGLDVRFLISKRENYGHIPITNVVAIRELKTNTVKIRHLQNSRLCHAKVIIVDGTAAILGSHNLSIKSCHNNFEVSFLTYCQHLTRELQNVYIHVWENAKDA